MRCVSCNMRMYFTVFTCTWTNYDIAKLCPFRKSTCRSVGTATIWVGPSKSSCRSLCARTIDIQRTQLACSQSVIFHDESLSTSPTASTRAVQYASVLDRIPTTNLHIRNLSPTNLRKSTTISSPEIILGEHDPQTMAKSISKGCYQEKCKVKRMEPGNILHCNLPAYWVHVDTNDCAAQ